jgi:hypothetical protein
MKGVVTVLSVCAFLVWTATKLLLLSFCYTAVAMRKYIGPCLRMGDVLAKLRAFLVLAFDGGELASLCDRLAPTETVLCITG